MSLLRALAAARERDAAVRAYLEGPGPHGLHLGAGSHVLPGWFNTDLVPAPPHVRFLDSAAPFPFPEGSLDHVLSEHHIEHLGFADGQATLRECRRVLRPGGVLRIATPSLEVLAGLVSGPLNEREQRYISFVGNAFLPPGEPAGAAAVVNNAFRNWGHQFLYDRATLAAGLATAGFVDVVDARPGQSRWERLRGVEGHGDFLADDDVNDFETMVIEATCPPPDVLAVGGSR